MLSYPQYFVTTFHTDILPCQTQTCHTCSVDRAGYPIVSGYRSHPPALSFRLSSAAGHAGPGQTEWLQGISPRWRPPVLFEGLSGPPLTPTTPADTPAPGPPFHRPLGRLTVEHATKRTAVFDRHPPPRLESPRFMGSGLAGLPMRGFVSGGFITCWIVGEDPGRLVPGPNPPLTFLKNHPHHLLTQNKTNQNPLEMLLLPSLPPGQSDPRPPHHWGGGVQRSHSPNPTHSSTGGGYQLNKWGTK